MSDSQSPEKVIENWLSEGAGEPSTLILLSSLSFAGGWGGEELNSIERSCRSQWTELAD